MIFSKNEGWFSIEIINAPNNFAPDRPAIGPWKYPFILLHKEPYYFVFML